MTSQRTRCRHDVLLYHVGCILDSINPLQFSRLHTDLSFSDLKECNVFGDGRRIPNDSNDSALRNEVSGDFLKGAASVSWNFLKGSLVRSASYHPLPE